jgi:hypothetical protein
VETKASCTIRCFKPLQIHYPPAIRELDGGDLECRLHRNRQLRFSRDFHLHNPQGRREAINIGGGGGGVVMF